MVGKKMPRASRAAKRRRNTHMVGSQSISESDQQVHLTDFGHLETGTLDSRARLS
jgi:hypothetical protein